ncbi:hypothetical protein ACHAWF_007642 [Thalassiosira exigua]
MSTPKNKKRKSDRSDSTLSSQKGGALSTQTIDYLRAWMMSPEHIEHPYPNATEKKKIMKDTGITAKQLTCWFSNNRKRFWKPKMEEMGRGDVVESAMSNTLTPQTIEYLKAWMMSPEHVENPYPTDEEKAQIMAATGIEKKQLSCWLSNNRKRFWKPRIDKLREQYGLKESDRLPAALLATVAYDTASPTAGDNAFDADPDDMFLVAPAVESLDDIYADEAAAGVLPAAELPPEEKPLENVCTGGNAGFSGSMKQPARKRKKESLDDVVAV